MKSEQKIRSLIARLKHAEESPCDCEGEHVWPCLAGRCAMEAQRKGLQWVLEELSDAQILAPLTPPWKAEEN